MRDRPDYFPESLSGDPPYCEGDLVISVCDSIYECRITLICQFLHRTRMTGCLLHSGILGKHHSPYRAAFSSDA